MSIQTEFSHGFAPHGRFVPMQDADALDRIAEGHLRDQLVNSALGSRGEITVSVHNGVATLDGTVSDDPSLAVFKRGAVEAFPALTLIDNLVWVIPDCGVGLV